MAAAGRQYFSEMEKSLLTELVSKHQDVLENKKNDYKIIKKKNSTWDNLAEEFSSQTGTKKRDAKQLKKCWENIKSRAKKLFAKEKREIKLTGGGKASPVRDETAAAVAAIIQDQVEPLDNRYDDDNYESGTFLIINTLPATSISTARCNQMYFNIHISPFSQNKNII